MTSLRKYWWTALTLAAFAGCNTEESSPTAGGPTAANPGPAPTAGPVTAPEGTPAPSTTPAAKPDSDKADAKGGSKADAPPPVIEAPKTDDKKDDKKDAPKAKAGDSKAENVKLSDEELANVKKLPEADQAIALKQLLCPVSDEHLGEMGTPIKVSAEGKTFFLCCKSCEKEVKSNPKAVVAKLKN